MNSPLKFRVLCTCGKPLQVSRANVGKTGRCPTCKSMFVIPAPPDSQPSPPSSVSDRKAASSEFDIDIDLPDVSLDPNQRSPSMGFSQESKSMLSASELAKQGASQPMRRNDNASLLDLQLPNMAAPGSLTSPHFASANSGASIRTSNSPAALKATAIIFAACIVVGALGVGTFYGVRQIVAMIGGVETIPIYGQEVTAEEVRQLAQRWWTFDAKSSAGKTAPEESLPFSRDLALNTAFAKASLSPPNRKKLYESLRTDLGNDLSVKTGLQGEGMQFEVVPPAEQEKNVGVQNLYTLNPSKDGAPSGAMIQDPNQPSPQIPNELVKASIPTNVLESKEFQGMGQAATRHFEEREARKKESTNFFETLQRSERPGCKIATVRIIDQNTSKVHYAWIRYRRAKDLQPKIVDLNWFDGNGWVSEQLRSKALSIPAVQRDILDLFGPNNSGIEDSASKSVMEICRWPSGDQSNITAKYYELPPVYQEGSLLQRAYLRSLKARGSHDDFRVAYLSFKSRFPSDPTCAAMFLEKAASDGKFDEMKSEIDVLDRAARCDRWLDWYRAIAAIGQSNAQDATYFIASANTLTPKPQGTDALLRFVQNPDQKPAGKIALVGDQFATSTTIFRKAKSQTDSMKENAEKYSKEMMSKGTNMQAIREQQQREMAATYGDDYGGKQQSNADALRREKEQKEAQANMEDYAAKQQQGGQAAQQQARQQQMQDYAAKQQQQYGGQKQQNGGQKQQNSGKKSRN